MRFSGYTAISSAKQMLAVFREGDEHFTQKCRDRNWEGNLKLFSESRGSDNGRRGDLVTVILLTELKGHAPVSLFSLVLIFPFFFLLCCSSPVLAAFAAF